MYKAIDLKIGTLFLYNDEPCKVLDYKHTHMGRGSADVRLKIKGLISDSVTQVVFAPSERFDEASLTKKKMQYLYRDSDTLYFMDQQTYDQIELKAEEMGEEMDFLQENNEYSVLYWEEKVLGVEIPPKVDLKILECDPGVKGNSAANMYKSAVVEGNIKIKVPLFIEVGEKIRVDTINRKYVERAK